MSSYKVTFEIGNKGTLKPQKSKEGYTHDWELYVQGCDDADISQYVEKVVFTLHESFKNPKRVIKEPPYIVRESGYAGFLLPIQVYFKSKDDPKRIDLEYDLILENIDVSKRAERKHHVFFNPSEEFRKKLLKGGAVPTNPVGTNSDEKNYELTGDRAVMGKSKAGTNSANIPINNESMKKHKIRSEDTTKTPNTFANLFGPPITKSSSAKNSHDSKSAKTTSKFKQTASKMDKLYDAKLSDNMVSDRDKTEKNKHNSISKDAVDGKRNVGNDEYGNQGRVDKREDKKNNKKEFDSTKDSSVKESNTPSKTSRASPKRSTSPINTSSPRSKQKVMTSSSASITNVEYAQTSNVLPKYLIDNNNENENYKSNNAKKLKKDKRERSHEKTRDPSKKVRDREKDNVDDQRLVIKSTNIKKDREVNPGTGSVAGRETDNTIKQVLSDDSKIKSTESKQNVSPVVKHKHNDMTQSKSVKENDKKTDRDYDRKHSKHKKKEKNKDKDKQREYNKKKDQIFTNKNDYYKLSNKSKIDEDLHNEKFSQKNNLSKTKMNDNIIDKLTSESDEESLCPTDDLLEKSAHSNITNSPANTISLVSTVPQLKENDDVIIGNKKSVKNDTNRNNINNVSTINSQPGMSKSLAKSPKSVETKEQKQTKCRNDDNIDAVRKQETTISPSSPFQLQTDQLIQLGTRSRKDDYENCFNENNEHDEMQSENSVSDNAQLDIVSTSPNSNYTLSSRPSTDSVFKPPSLPADYMTELRLLKQKITSIENNNDLQQVVEIIASTGCYEITSDTFDFDLCILDRITVQRLQEFITDSTTL